MDYQGVDWVATALTFLATWLLSERRRSGFLVMIAANGGWLAVAFMADSPAMVVANVVLFAMNLRGWLRWGPPTAVPAG